MNLVMMRGRLTKDVELVKTTSGISFTRFTIAVTRKYSDTNGDKVTDFFNCVAWKGLAENMSKFLNKGSHVLITGELQNDTWEDNGVKKTTTKISVNDCEFLDSKPQGEENKPQPHADLKPVNDEDLPF